MCSYSDTLDSFERLRDDAAVLAVEEVLWKVQIQVRQGRETTRRILLGTMRMRNRVNEPPLKCRIS